MDAPFSHYAHEGTNPTPSYEGYNKVLVAMCECTGYVEILGMQIQDEAQISNIA